MGLILHTADWHYGNRRDDVWLDRQASAMRWLFKEAKRANVDAVVASGDLLEYSVVDTLGPRFYRELITSWMQYRGPFIVIPGNHDLPDVRGKGENSLGVLRSLQIFESKIRLLEFGQGCRVSGMRFYAGFPEKKLLVELAEKIKEGDSEYPTEPSIVMLHALLDGSRMANGVSGRGMSPTQLTEIPVDYWALGDVHLRQDILPNAWYPGSLAQTNFGEEASSGGFLLVEVTRGNPVAIVGVASNTSDVSLLKAYEHDSTMSWEDGLGSTFLPGMFHKVKLTGARGDVRAFDKQAAEVRMKEHGAAWITWEDSPDEAEIVDGVEQNVASLLTDTATDIDRFIGCMSLGDLDGGELSRRAQDVWGRHEPEDLGEAHRRVGFDRMVLANVGPYQELEIPLSDLGAVQIIGKNLDMGGSNGSGKSYPFTAMENALFDGSGWGVKKDELRTSFLKGDSVSEIVFNDVKGRPHRAVNTRKQKGVGSGISLSQWIDGKWEDDSLKKTTDTVKRIEECVGMSQEDFGSLVYLGVNYKHGVLDATPEGRRKFLSSIFGLEPLDDCYAEAAALHTKLLEESRLSVNRMETLQEDIDRKTEVLDGFRKDIEPLVSIPDELEAEKKKRVDLEAAGQEKALASTTCRGVIEQFDAFHEEYPRLLELDRKMTEMQDVSGSLDLVALRQKDLSGKLSRLTMKITDLQGVLRYWDSWDQEAPLRADHEKKKEIAERDPLFGTAPEVLDAEVTQVVTEIAKLNAGYAVVEKELTGYKRLGDACPTCEQEISPEFREEKERGLQEELRRIGRERVSLERQKAELEKKKQLVKVVQDADLALSRLAKEPDRPRVDVQEELTKFEEQLRATREEATQADAEAQRLAKIDGANTEVKASYDQLSPKFTKGERFAFLTLSTTLPMGWDEFLNDPSSAGPGFRQEWVDKGAVLAEETEKLRGDYRTVTARIDELNESHGRLLEMSRSLLLGKKQLEEIMRQMEKERGVVADTADEIRYTQLLSEVFHPVTGVKHSKITRILEELNPLANKYLTALSNGTMEVKVSPSHESKTKRGGQTRTIEGVTISASDPIKGTLSWVSWSAGERRRIGVSVILGTWELLQQYTRKGANILILDEIFHGMDPMGIQRVQEILPRLAKLVGSLFVISHHALDKAGFNRIWWITKKRGLSTLQEEMLAT